MSAESPVVLGDATSSHHHHAHAHHSGAPAAHVIGASPFEWSALQRLGTVAIILALLWAAILWTMV